jgi:hypothetical protein
MKKLVLLAIIIGLIIMKNVIVLEENVIKESEGFEIYKKSEIEYNHEVVDEYIYAMEGYIA